MAEDAEKPKLGRPSSFTQEKADEICVCLMDGLSLRKICSRKDMPDRVTVFRWLANNETFRIQYAHAREIQADTYADDTIDIADDGSNDTYTDEEGNKRTDHDVIARSRLRVDARKWAASKLAPKKYGDKVALVGDPAQPLHTETTLNVSGLSTQALAEIMAARDASEPK